MKHTTNRQSFTLIELLLAMALLSILIVLLTGNFSTTLKRGRDQQRKNDLNQVQKVLELYYEDNQKYPIFTPANGGNEIFGKKLCTSKVTAFNSSCPVTDTTYMIKTPQDPSSSYVYKYVPDATGSSYYLYSYIENDLDQGSGVSKTGFNTDVYCDSAGTLLCRYYVSSSNADPLTPN